MTPDEFRQFLPRGTEAELLDLCLRDDRPPYVFDAKHGAWDQFRQHLATQLDLSPHDIRVVGSGRLGFSMKPGQNLRDFRDRSDIDVMVVNAARFDELWLALLRAAYPRGAIASRLAGWLATRRNELYTGWLTPLEMRLDAKIYGPRAIPVLQFNARWFNALKQASQYPSRRHEDITGRLYRTWDHADFYHLSSIAELRASLSV